MQALTPLRAKALEWQFSKREAHCSGQVEAVSLDSWVDSFILLSLYMGALKSNTEVKELSRDPRVA